MTTPSLHQQTGLTVSYTDPLLRANRSAIVRTLTDELDGYSHETRAAGGYWSASIRVSDVQSRLEDWISAGLMRHIVTYSTGLEVVWEGFVNRISVNFGSFSYQIGPLLDIGNRVRVVYSVIDTSVEPPTLGVRAVTANANGTTSQALYGIIEKVLSTGGSTATEAAQNRDTWLAENAMPPVSIDLNLSGGSEPSLALDCLGYWHLFGAYTYTNTGVTGTENLSTKIQNIINADPNSLFSTDFSRITTNTLQVKQYENDDKTAEALLKALNSLGDTSDNRYTIGVYQNRQLWYQAAPTTVEYLKRITVSDDFTTPTGATVRPSSVLPGRWVLVPDFLVGRTQPNSRTILNDDPRAGFIEVVRFDAPREVRVSGGKLSQLDQALAKQGLAGVGA